MADNHVYRPLAPDEIRLFSIFESTKDQTTYQIQHVRLKGKLTPPKDNMAGRGEFRKNLSYLNSRFIQRKHPFIALSYAWDGQTPEYDIAVLDASINKRSVLKVTKNICTALPYLSSLYPGRLWWIDAICIDQANVEEKSAQIPLMRDIYMHADKVAVWLGEIKPELQAAIDAMDLITQSLKSGIESLDTIEHNDFSGLGACKRLHGLDRSSGTFQDSLVWSNLDPPRSYTSERNFGAGLRL